MYSRSSGSFNSSMNSTNNNTYQYQHNPVSRHNTYSSPSDRSSLFGSGTASGLISSSSYSTNHHSSSYHNHNNHQSTNSPPGVFYPYQQQQRSRPSSFNNYNNSYRMTGTHHNVTSPSSMMPRHTPNERLSTTNLYIRGLSTTTTDQFLFEMCKEYGKITSTKGSCMRAARLNLTGYGFVDFDNCDDADRAVNALVAKGIQAQMAKQQEQDPTNLYVANLPIPWVETDLEGMFSTFGCVISTRILKNADNISRGVGFARMESREKCQELIEKYNGHTLPGFETLDPLIVKLADSNKNKKRLNYDNQSNCGLQASFDGNSAVNMGGNSSLMMATSGMSPYGAGRFANFSVGQQYYAMNPYLPTQQQQLLGGGAGNAVMPNEYYQSILAGMHQLSVNGLLSNQNAISNPVTQPLNSAPQTPSAITTQIANHAGTGHQAITAAQQMPPMTMHPGSPPIFYPFNQIPAAYPGAPGAYSYHHGVVDNLALGAGHPYDETIFQHQQQAAYLAQQTAK